MTLAAPGDQGDLLVTQPLTSRVALLALRTEQSTQALTFTYSVHAQSPEGTSGMGSHTEQGKRVE